MFGLVIVSGKYSLEHEKDEGREDSASRQCNYPGNNNSTDNPQIYGANTPGQAYTDHRPHQNVSGGHRQPGS